jgi:hypothetical protein
VALNSQREFAPAVLPQESDPEEVAPATFVDAKPTSETKDNIQQPPAAPALVGAAQHKLGSTSTKPGARYPFRSFFLCSKYQSRRVGIPQQPLVDNDATQIQACGGQFRSHSAGACYICASNSPFFWPNSSLLRKDTCVQELLKP